MELIWPERLLNEAEAAQYLGIARGTLSVWRCVGRHELPYVRVGRRIKYKFSDLQEWISSRTVNRPQATKRRAHHAA
jgi:excisionase family DNA binding protein